MATAKQLQSQLEKLTARIAKQQTELAGLKEKQKEVKAQLAEAKKTSKGGCRRC